MLIDYFLIADQYMYMIIDHELPTDSCYYTLIHVNGGLRFPSGKFDKHCLGSTIHAFLKVSSNLLWNCMVFFAVKPTRNVCMGIKTGLKMTSFDPFIANQRVILLIWLVAVTVSIDFFSKFGREILFFSS